MITLLSIKKRKENTWNNQQRKSTSEKPECVLGVFIQRYLMFPHAQTHLISVSLMYSLWVHGSHCINTHWIPVGDVVGRAVPHARKMMAHVVFCHYYSYHRERWPYRHRIPMVFNISDLIRAIVVISSSFDSLKIRGKNFMSVCKMFVPIPKKINPKVPCMWEKHSTTELYPKSTEPQNMALWVGSHMISPIWQSAATSGKTILRSHLPYANCTKPSVLIIRNPDWWPTVVTNKYQNNFKIQLEPTWSYRTYTYVHSRG